MGNCCFCLGRKAWHQPEENLPALAQRFCLQYSDSVNYSPRKTSLDCQSFDLQWFQNFCIGINIFNTVPRLGIHYLTKEGFLADSPTIVSCFLLNCKGLSKLMIGRFLSDQNDSFASDVLKRLTEQLNFSGLMVDEALRLFQEQFHLVGSHEQVEAVLAVFSNHYIECNPELVEGFASPNTVPILACSLYMLDIDIKSMGKKHILSKTEFIAAVKESTKDELLETTILEEMYKSLIIKPFAHGWDLTAEIDNLHIYDKETNQRVSLIEPHRRLVFDCSIQRYIDQDDHIYHQVHVFLCNDIIVVTKLNVAGTFCLVRKISLLAIEMDVSYNKIHHHSFRLKDQLDDKVLLKFVTYTALVKKQLETALSEMITETEQTCRILSEYEDADENKEKLEFVHEWF